MLKKRYRSAKQIDGIIDVERLRSGPSRCLERNAELFFDLTFLRKTSVQCLER